MKKEFAQNLLKKVTADYNNIAGLWSIKRWKLPSDIKALEEYIEEGDHILDLGCGNGYFFELLKDKKASYIGVDISEKQIEICKKKYPEAKYFVTKPLELPFADGEFSKIFCLSTIHHIPGKAMREVFMSEIKRVLKQDGILVLTAWNLPNNFQNIIKKFRDKFRNPSLDWGDIYYPFKDSMGENHADRYIHCFTKKEIEKLVTDADFSLQRLDIVKRGKGKFQNIITISKKV